MNFKQRFSRYFIGVLLGLILVFAFFGKRSCNDWMPNKRVLLRLSQTDLIITQKARCKMDCYGLVDEDLFHLLKTGNVNFRESNPRGYPLIYVVVAERESDNLEYAMNFEARDSSSTLINVFLEETQTCDCD